MLAAKSYWPQETPEYKTDTYTNFVVPELDHFTAFKLINFHLYTLHAVDNVQFCHCLTFLFLVISYTT